MAIDLKAVFRVQDSGSSKLRRIMQQTDRLSRSTQQATRATDNYRDSQGRLRNAMGRFVSESSRATNANKRFATSLSGIRVGANGVSGSLNGMQSALLGIVGAYASVQGAKSLFENTLGKAMQLEASTVAIDAIFNDKKASNSYLDMVKKMSVDSPVLNQTEMLSSSKGLIASTKNVKDLENIWKIAEKLMVLSPEQGTEGAAFALKEMFSGDAVSLSDRFNISKKQLNSIKGLAIPDQIRELTKLLDGMGMTDQAVQRMGETSMASWNGVQERFEAFLQVVGGDGNKTMGKFYRRLSGMFDSDSASKFADKLGNGLNYALTKAISIGEWLWKWKQPISYIVGGITAAASAFMIIGTLSLLANPLALITAGIAGAAVGFKALYDNSESFRGVIDGIKSKVSELWSAFKTGGTGGLLNSLFGEGTAEKVASIVDKVKTKFGELKGGFTIVKDALAQGWTVISDVFSNAWTLIQPILSGIWSMLKVVGEYATIAFNNIIAPALSFVMQLFSTLWAIAKPILTMIGGLFEVLGAVVTVVWKNILAPLMEFVTTAFSNAFNNLSGVLEIVAGWFDTLGRWANTAKGYLSDFASVIAGIKLPDWVTSGISTVVTTVSKAIGAGTVDGSHYSGLDSVPFDGYVAKLHKNEKILPAKEAKEYRAAKANGGFGGGVTISGNTFNVRQESDIEKIAYQLAKLIERERLQIG